MAADKQEVGFTPPYLSWKTFLNLILRMQKEGIPARIDQSYLASTAPVTQGYLIAALRGFGLLNDDKTPTQALFDLVENEGERPKIIGDLVKSHYSAQMALPKNASASQLWETFKGQSGETKRKAVTFFLQAASYADLNLSPLFKAPPRGPSRNPRGGSKPPKDAGKNGETSETPARDTGEEATSITLPSGAIVTLGLSQSVLTLPREERKFIMDVVDLLQDEEAPQSEVETDPAEEPDEDEGDE